MSLLGLLEVVWVEVVAALLDLLNVAAVDPGEEGIGLEVLLDIVSLLHHL